MTANKNALIEELSGLLADSYVLYLKTQNFHWNVTGPNFQSLHVLFETQYTELATAVDEIAERIRTVGAPAPGTYAQFLKLAKVSEEEGLPDAQDMLLKLALDQDRIVTRARGVIAAAEALNDEGSIDLATQRISVHEKNRWMLSAHLEPQAAKQLEEQRTAA